MNGETLSLADLRSRLGGLGGQRYWRSLEELAETEQFQDLLHREFPRQAGEWLDPVSRRGFLKLMAASLALAGVGGCVQPLDEKILPYVQPPEEMLPGQPLYFATACTLRGYAQGLLVESHMGRPTKVEGNPGHPLNGRGDGSSFGATDLFAQASVLTLYDPDRSQVVTHLGRISTWDGFLAELGPALDAHRTRGGAGLRILTQSVTSPTLAARLAQLLGALPNARWTVYEPVDRESVRAGSRQAFGAEYETQYHLDKAKAVVSLDADLLSTEPGSLRYARELVDGRRVRKGHPEMNRLYVVESTPSITGGMADHRLPLRSADIEAFGRALGRALVAKGLSAQGWEELLEAAPGGPGFEEHKAWLDAAASDLMHNQGAALVVAGEGQPPALHALAHALNSALGGVGKTVGYTRPVQASSATGSESLAALAEAIDAGQVTLLLIVGGNPAFDAPADFRFAQRLAKVPLRVHLGLYEDETSELCHWHLPEAHELESWGDARAWDGTVSVLQPLISPLYAGKSAHELLAALAGEPGKSSYELVRETWAAGRTPEELERFWRRSLHDGVVAGTALPPEIPALSLQKPVEPPAAAKPGLEIVFRPDPSVWDGRFSNNGWLQEMPRPLTKLTWDNAALLAPATAEKLGLRNEDVVELRLQGRSVRAPVWILPGNAADSVTVHLGYGRRRTGRVGTGAGFDAYALRSSGAMGFATGLEVLRTPERSTLACTQDHHSMEGRDIVRSSPIAGLLAKLGSEAAAAEGEHGEPAGAHGEAAGAHGEDHHPSLLPDFEYKGYAWGMSVDLNACTGCNACSMACVAENNTPVVGKDQVARGREMHWLRLDRYFGGSLDNPETLFQPMACQHCEKAPCEVVCPVAATVHSDEGLNDMVYNRCVGTRYCSNNCPYKVRRFNFFQYSDFTTETLKLLRNPDVTVRSRGVMEKCTYCVQRINTARIEAKNEDRKIRDGEIVAACQQACPTEAIVFGDLNDPESRVAKLKKEPLRYLVLDELGVQPRTSYLGRAKNPNPDLGSGGAG